MEGFEQFNCYEFNRTLKRNFDDGRCEHCKKYLTTVCEHIDEFLEDIEDLEDID